MLYFLQTNAAFLQRTHLHPVWRTCSHNKTVDSRAVGKERVENGTRDGRQNMLQSKKMLFEAI